MARFHCPRCGLDFIAGGDPSKAADQARALAQHQGHCSATVQTPPTPPPAPVPKVGGGKNWPKITKERGKYVGDCPICWARFRGGGKGWSAVKKQMALHYQQDHPRSAYARYVRTNPEAWK